MIPIKIDDENIDFRNFHFNKIQRKIKARIICKQKHYATESFEYQVLDWIHWNLDLILKEDTSKLRKIIQEFNNFILTHAINLQLTKEDYNEYCTVDSLIDISKKNEIAKPKGIGRNKRKWIDLIFNNQDNIDNSTINNIKIELKLEETKSILTNIFIDFYEKEWDKIKDYDRYTFVTKHNLKTCPYCNMGYILISQKVNGKNGLRPEIDHFFPKSKYPYLAMSFYNLIPSCQVCNHTKKDKDTYTDNLLSPYEIDDNTFKLTYRPKDIDFYQIKKQKYNVNNSLEIEFRKIDEHSNEYFKLDKLYEQHKDIVLELLVKRTVYSKSYITELKNNFHFTDDGIYRFLFCNYRDSDEYSKRPLSKLIKDITDELGLI